MNINNLLISWRSVVGFLAMVAGVISALIGAHIFPGSFDSWLVGAGAVVLAAERVAQALESPSSGNVSAAVSASEAAAAKLLSDFQAFQKSQVAQ